MNVYHLASKAGKSSVLVASVLARDAGHALGLFRSKYGRLPEGHSLRVAKGPLAAFESRRYGMKPGVVLEKCGLSNPKFA